MFCFQYFLFLLRLARFLRFFGAFAFSGGDGLKGKLVGIFGFNKDFLGSGEGFFEKFFSYGLLNVFFNSTAQGASTVGRVVAFVDEEV